MTDYADLTLAEAATQIRQKALSPVEYLQALLGRIETYDAHYNAFLRQTPDIALRQARQAEAEILAGTWRGPLHGVPYGLKDIIDVAGVPTTAHSKILADNLARTDAVVTQRLHAAGGVLVGKLATHEFAMGGRPVICPGRQPGMPGIGTTSPAGPPVVLAWPWQRALYLPPWARTPVGRSATRPRCAALLA
jgi:Asp-tRNA(Asn)/Glu-tRNA(Gln) amidotransferase A subunit family amidase